MSLIVGAILVALTVAMHSTGTTLITQFLARRANVLMGWFPRLSRSAVLIPTALLLFLLHCVEIGVWAIAYWTLTDITELPTFDDALYFSAVAYTTLGFGDITLNSNWRILSGMESMNGILLSGWSTALLFVIVQRLWQVTMKE